jgi:hypothetical protein
MHNPMTRAIFSVNRAREKLAIVVLLSPETVASFFQTSETLFIVSYQPAACSSSRPTGPSTPARPSGGPRPPPWLPSRYRLLQVRNDFRRRPARRAVPAGRLHCRQLLGGLNKRGNEILDEMRWRRGSGAQDKLESRRR